MCYTTETNKEEKTLRLLHEEEEQEEQEKNHLIIPTYFIITGVFLRTCIILTWKVSFIQEKKNTTKNLNLQ